MILLQITQELGKSIQLIDKFKSALMEFAPKLIGAIILVIIGRWVIGQISAAANRIFAKKSFDPSLQTFLRSLIRMSLTIMLFISAANLIGINITAFAALLAGAGVAIGSALNGTLGNLAGGVMILIFKPFKVGDQIEAQGSNGVVTEIGIFHTSITTAERKTVILPNGGLATGVITNFNTSGSLRVDIPINIQMSESIDKVRQIAIDTMLQHPHVLKNPAPTVVVTKIADGMVTLSLRPSAQQEHYGFVFVEVQEMIKNAFDAHNIEGPNHQKLIINKI
jgi:small conductance mechanosensitive channel